MTTRSPWICIPALTKAIPPGIDAGLAADFYTVENSVVTGARGSEEKLAVARDPGSRLIHVSGTMPLDAPPRRLTIAIEEPAEYAASLLARLLEARGVKDRWPTARAPRRGSRG